MRILNNLKISVKLPLTVFLIGLLTLVLVEWIALTNARQTVLSAGADRLLAVAESRASEISTGLDSLTEDAAAQARNPVTLEVARGFVTSWKLYGPGADADLRRLYVIENPHLSGNRSALIMADDSSAYSLVHRRFHPYLLSRLRTRGYSDILLISAEGQVVYSVNKDAMFGANLRSGMLQHTGLARIFESVAAAPADAPAEVMGFGLAAENMAFVAMPVRSPFGTLEAVLAFRIDLTMFRPILMRRAGLGRTGVAAFAGAGNTGLIGTPDEEAPSSALPRFESLPAAARGVLAQRPGDGAPKDLVAYARLSFGGRAYAVLARQDRFEILAAAGALRERIFLQGLAALSAVSVFGLFLARSMSVPLDRVSQNMARIAAGNCGGEIPDQGRRDEIGQIARQLDRFRASLVEADALSRETAFKGAAFETASAALMLVDRNLIILFSNRRMGELLEQHRISLGRTVLDFNARAVTGRVLTSFLPAAERMQAALTDQPGPIRENLRLGDAYVMVEMASVATADGQVAGYVIEWSDVTEPQQTRAVLQTIYAQMPVATFAMDGRLIFSNPLFEDWVGETGLGLQGRTWSDLFGPANWEEVLSMAEDVDAAATVALELPDLAPAGRSADMRHGTIRPVADAFGRNRRCVLLATGPRPHVASPLGRSGLPARVQERNVG